MKSIAAAEFKEQCLEILAQLDAEGIIITKNGQPVARLTPIERASADLVGSLRGRIRIKGDIKSAGVTWDSQAAEEEMLAADAYCYYGSEALEFAAASARAVAEALSDER